jgi:hypothetical protein
MVTRLTTVVLALALTALARADEKKDDRTTKVTGTVIVQKDVPSFEGRVLELRLYASEKSGGEKKVDLVEKVEIKEFTHFAGTDTKKEFILGAKGERKENARYYITAFVLKRDDRTHIGQADHAKGPLNEVLTNGNPREVTIRMKEIGKK